MRETITNRENAVPSGTSPKTRRANDEQPDAALLIRRLAKHCAAYQGADTKRGVIQLMTTLAPFVILCAAVLVSFGYEFWAGGVLALPAAALLIRLFIIQHDCGHQSFFKSRAANDWLGRLISVVTLTPYGFWRKSHAVHHSAAGNLDRRGVGDVSTLSVQEYKALPARKRFAYRLYRNPIILFIIGAPYHFVIHQRIPWGQVYPFRKVWRSILPLNLAVAVVYGVSVTVFGWKPAMGALLIFVLAAWIGGWLFFIQHQFEDTYWGRDKEWDFHSAAVFGSSYYALPRVLEWFTGHIGLHHIHHLCSKIPNYRLKECLEGSPELQKMNRLSLLDSLKCCRLALWDEELGKLVGFRDIKTA